MVLILILIIILALGGKEVRVLGREVWNGNGRVGDMIPLCDVMGRDLHGIC